jgi:hypothetical protein
MISSGSRSRDRKGEIRAMYTNQLLVASRIGDLRTNAATERLARSARAGSQRTGVFAGFRSLLAGAEKSQPLPKLTDYPFRS